MSEEKDVIPGYEKYGHVKYPRGRKSLAVDFDTWVKLQKICDVNSRSIIDQLRHFIKEEHARIDNVSE